MNRRAPSNTRAWLVVVIALAALAADPATTLAQSSGGYSRPGASRSGGYGGGFRTPSTSGGYSRPSRAAPRSYDYGAAQSPGDRSFSQGRSGAALDNYRTQQDNTRQQRTYSTQPSYQPPAYQPRPSYQPPAQYAPRQYSTAPSQPGWFANRGWSGQPSYSGGNRSFGAWNGFFLGALLSNLTRPGSADFFHNNQNDAGYQQWRAEADRQANDNADLRQKLVQLDAQLAEREGQPRTPGALPPDVPAEVAKAPPARTPEMPGQGGSPWVWVVLVAGAGGLGYLTWQRRASTRAPMSPSTPLQSAGNLLRHKLSGEGYTPSKFRVGMTLALDPTPFILAADSIKLQQPQGTGSGQVGVAAVGQVTSGQTALTRLYLADGRSLVQLHLDAAGDPDECRLFGTIDEVTPSDPTEWGVWLDPAQGLIGWPAFQTKDGKTYDRVWAPSDGRVSPRAFTETIEATFGSRTVQSQVMLYAAPTGAPDPAPPTEYIMVSALQDGGRAWVEIRAGIDLNPATLQLA